MLLTTTMSTLILALPFAFTHPTTTLTPRFVSGWCGLHVTQYQKNENGVGGDYQYDIRIYDAIGGLLGGVDKLDIPDLQTKSVDSQLPFTLDITSGLIDIDPVTFAYNGQHWSTSDAQCKMGDYDSGSRTGDCGFTC